MTKRYVVDEDTKIAGINEDRSLQFVSTWHEFIEVNAEGFDVMQFNDMKQELETYGATVVFGFVGCKTLLRIATETDIKTWQKETQL